MYGAAAAGVENRAVPMSNAAADSVLITMHKLPIVSHQVLLTTEIDEDDPYYDDKCDVLENEVC